ncbi:Low-density lipoprotein receptors class A cysteine rich [Schistosoma japonicum]|nr:Low-density lipoprotein receptors class A cysteine rich [Schistosoma japonicum]
MNYVSFSYLYMFSCIHSAVAKTMKIDTQDCFGLPEKPFIIFGAVVSHTRAIGRTLCYFQPSDQNQYLSIYPTKLDLRRRFGTCPVIQINEFTSVRDELIDNTDVNMIIPMKVPDDTKLIFQANCTNYASMLDKTVHTSSSNLKIQILFDPANSAASDVTYQFIISSYGNLKGFNLFTYIRICLHLITSLCCLHFLYCTLYVTNTQCESIVLGPSYNCPSNTFRCWDAATNCIPDSLTCDTIANCHDGSDENGYLCRCIMIFLSHSIIGTGRINGIPIPLFAIIIAISFFGLILLVLTIVFVLRKQRQRKRREEQT